jgi:putative nucleotidyltransferase-like protein
VLAELASRLNLESYILESLGPSQRRLGPEAARWLAELRQQVSSAAIQNLLRDEELSEALSRLADEGIDLVLLKGAALRAERPGLAGRFQCDVDVLVRRRDLARAERLLQEMGFHLDESYLDREGLLERHFHFGYERRNAVVEMHWDLDTSSPAGFLDRFWERSRAVERDGRTFRIPSPEHHLLFGCLHLSRHCFRGGLRWLADLKYSLPVSPEIRERFESEAAAWPRRAVCGPLWMLSLHGVPGAGELAGGFSPGGMERLVLRRLLVALLLDEPWLRLPSWRAAQALSEWLFSEQDLLPLLAEVSREGILERLHARAGGRVRGEVV